MENNELTRLEARKLELERYIREKKEMVSVHMHSSKTRRELVTRLKERHGHILEEIKCKSSQLDSSDTHIRDLEVALNRRQGAGRSSCCFPSDRSEKSANMPERRSNRAAVKLPSANRVLGHLHSELRQLKHRLQERKIDERKRDSMEFEKYSDQFHVDHVKISYIPPTKGYQDGDEAAAYFGTFRLSPEYTFRMLTEDACIFFGISGKIAEKASLRDERNRIWSPHATVMGTMARELVRRSKSSTEPAGLPHISLTLPESKKKSVSKIEEETVDFRISQEEYYKRENVLERKRANMKTKLFEIRSKNTPMFHDDTKIEREVMDSYGHGFEECNVSAKNRRDFKFESHTRTHGDCIMMFFHVLFVIAMMIPLIHGRGWLYWKNDIVISISQQIGRSFTVTSAVDGSYADAVNRTNLQTPTHVMAFLKGPLLDAIFQCGDEVQGTCTTSATADDPPYSKYVLLGNVQMRQYRTDATLGRTSDSATCDGATTTRPYLYWMYDDNATQQISIRDSSIRCYSPYDNAYKSTTSFGSGTTYTYSDSSLTESIETKRVVFFENGFVQLLGTNYAAVESSLTALNTAEWIDRSTRSIVVHATMLNKNYPVMATLRVVVEMPPTGAVIVHSVVEYIPVSDYNIDNPSIYSALILCDVYICIYVACLAIVMIAKIRVVGIARFFRVMWNVIDVLVVFLTIMTLTSTRKTPHYYENLYDDISSSTDESQEGMYQGQVQASGNFLLCAASSIAAFQTLKFLSRNSQIQHFWRIIGIVIVDISVLLLMLCIFAVAFTLWLILASMQKTMAIYDIAHTFTCVLADTLLPQSMFEATYLINALKSFDPVLATMATCILMLARLIFSSLFLALFLTAFILVRADYHTEKEYRETHHGSAWWRGYARVKTREFWKHFLFGSLYLSKERKRTERKTA
eukprot:g412.t1